MKVITHAPGAPAPVGPYSRAVQSGGLLFCAGQIGLDPQTMKIVEGGVEAEAVQVLENLVAVLKAAGTGFDRVVMTTIFLAEISSGKIVNDVYSRYVVKDAPPARQTIAVKDLPMGALVEISVIAELA